MLGQSMTEEFQEWERPHSEAPCLEVCWSAGLWSQQCVWQLPVTFVNKAAELCLFLDTG